MAVDFELGDLSSDADKLIISVMMKAEWQWM